MQDNDSHVRKGAPEGQLALSGPSGCAPGPRLPVRGDLAHVGLAGRCFVPHYAVPLPHVLSEAASLLARPVADGEAMASLTKDARFDVLDIAGDWAWGQCADEPDGLVGYLPLAVLERQEA